MSVSCCLQTLSRHKDPAQEEFIKPTNTHNKQNPLVTFQESARTMQVDLVGRAYQKTMLTLAIQTHRMMMGWVLYLPIGKKLTPT